MKSIRSTKSIVTVASERTVASATDVSERHTPFEVVVSAAMAKMMCPVRVVVWPLNPSSPDRSKTVISKSSKVCTSYSSTMTYEEKGELLGGDTIALQATHNANQRLTEISVQKYRVQDIPREFMQILAIILPKYTKLFKITIADCSINMYTIYELGEIVTSTTITDVCLDSSCVTEGNYAILLDQGSLIQNLSLKNCRINDDVCKEIASRLHYSAPGKTTLLTLNLSSNHISDVGAKHIADALKSNRHLRYLNLADNHITDEGASHIFDKLKEFPLSAEDTYGKRKQRMNYLKNKNELYSKLVQDFHSHSINRSIDMSSRKSGRSKKALVSTRSVTKRLHSGESDDFESVKLELMAAELMEPFYHPFSESNTTLKYGHSYCKGNFVLCYLNLAYNNVMYPSVKKLLEVLQYQRNHKNSLQSGLMRVVLDGNKVPDCEELDTIHNIFRQAIVNAGPSRRARNQSSSKHEMK